MTQPEVERGGAPAAPEGAKEGWRKADRLAALARYAILDTPREAAFDDLAQLAADILGAPIGVINLIADDRQWFKAEVGLGVRETPLHVSICRHALLQDESMVVPDLAGDDRFRDNPLVAAAEGLRFYAGAVLRTPDGLPLGTVCVLDTVPRPDGIDEQQRRALATLAGQVMAQFELRRSEALARRESRRAARHARRVALLAQAAERLLVAADAPAMLEGVFALLAPEFELDMAVNFACGEGSFALAAACGLTPEEVRRTGGAAFAEIVCALVAETREAVHIADVQRSEEPRLASIRAMGLDAYYSAPLLAEGTLLGTVSFGRRGRGFSRGELHVLSAVASHMATAQRRLRADGERLMLAQAVEQSSDLIGLADPSGRAIYLNEAGRRMVGLKDAEAVAGTRLADYVAPEDWGVLKTLIRSARGDQGRWAGSVRLRHFETGASVPAHLSHFEIRDARGAPVALAVVGRDTSERDRLVEARRQSEARFRTLFESAGVGLALMDDEGVVLDANPAFAAIAGRDPAALAGAPLLALVHPEDAARAEAVLARVMATGEPATIEMRHRRPDGAEIWASSRVSRLRDEAGRPASLLAVTVDIGERMRATAALARRSRQLQDLAETALAVARAETLEATLEAVTVAARRIVGAHQGVVSLTRGANWSQAISTTAFTDKYDAWRGYEAVPDGSGIYAWVCERNRPARMTQAELEAHPRWRGFGTHAAEHPPMRGWLAVPLVGRDGRNLGLIQLSDKEEGAEFDAADEAMLVQLAQLASAAVEQSQAEAALRVSEERFRLMADSSPALIWVCDAEARITFANKRYEEVFGRPASDVHGEGWRRIVHPDDVDRFFAAFHAAFAARERFRADVRVLDRDGVALWLHCEGVPHHAGDGRFAGYIGTNLDVTEGKAAEEALRQKALEFEALAENVSQLAWMAEPDGHIFWYNKRWYDYTGTTFEAMQGWGWRAVHHPDHVERVTREVEAHWARGEPFEGTYLLRSASGEFRPFLTRAEPIRDAQGRLVRWFGTNTDVTELLDLRETGERYRTIVESAREFAIFTLDTAGTITSWNIGAARLFGYHQDEAIGRLSSMIFTPEDIVAGAPEAELRLAAEQGRAENERFYGRADGSRFWASGWAMPLHDRPSGAPTGFLKILQDRTERRRAEEHMRLMVNELNHRVKNSLATVQAIAQQTLLTSDGVERARGAITQRLQALADAHDVLTRESWEGADLADVVAAALRPFAAEDPARLDARGPTVRLTPRTALSLNLALHELCTNAAKYGALAQPGGSVRIRWTAEAVGEARRLRLEWRERGGPPVEGPPRRAGFGTRLIRMALAAEPEGRVEMAFEPEGLVCTFEAALE